MVSQAFLDGVRRGVAKRHVPPAKRFWSKVDVRGPGECWEWQSSRFHFGHGQFWIEGTNRPAHRVAWEFENGPIPTGLQVCHHCDNPPCVNPAHLYVGTALDNKRDALVRGRAALGERHPRAKLTKAMVIEARRRFAAGESSVQMHHDFPVSLSALQRAISGHSWKRIQAAAAEKMQEALG